METGRIHAVAPQFSATGKISELVLPWDCIAPAGGKRGDLQLTECLVLNIDRYIDRNRARAV